VTDVVAAIALGVGAGMLAGLFGVGGGILFVPTLTLILGLTQVQAEATSLLAIVPVALVGSWRNTRTGTVRWRDAAAIGLFSITTGVAGAAIANAVTDRSLRIAFAGLIVLTAAQLIWRCFRLGPVEG
jgi:uncharacterized membrane protein YfcA